MAQAAADRAHENGSRGEALQAVHLHRRVVDLENYLQALARALRRSAVPAPGAPEQDEGQEELYQVRDRLRGSPRAAPPRQVARLASGRPATGPPPAVVRGAVPPRRCEPLNHFPAALRRWCAASGGSTCQPPAPRTREAPPAHCAWRACRTPRRTQRPGVDK